MNAGTWRIIAMLAVPTLALPANAQQSPVHPTTYTNTDGSFQFSYPSNFQVCTAGKMDPCRLRFYIPPCEEDAIVCVVNPAGQFADTNFGAAAFQVREIQTQPEAITSDTCGTPPTRTSATGDPYPWPSFSIPAQHPNETIGGVLFVHGVTGGAAMSHQNYVDLYRAFHLQTCYELSLTKSQTSAAVYDPPRKTLTPAQQKGLDQTLFQILHSFSFLK